MAVDYGTAKSNAFVLQNATIMLGELGQGEDLVPEEHSIGLFKEAATNIERNFTDLAQGVRNSIVHSELTSEKISLTGKGYEFSSKQIAYALGYDGSLVQTTLKTGTVSAAATLNATELTVSSTQNSWGVGDYAIISPAGDEDAGLIAMVTAVAVTGAAGAFSVVLTLDRPMKMPIPVGSKVQTSNLHYAGGDTYENVFKSLKSTSRDVHGRPMCFVMPKVKVTSSFMMAFTSSDYASIPFTFQSYAMTPDEPGYAQYKARGRAEMWGFTAT